MKELLLRRDTPDVHMHESCNVGVTRYLGPEMVSSICEGYMLVPCFEGEEDDQHETKDLPVAFPNRVPCC